VSIQFADVSVFMLPLQTVNDQYPSRAKREVRADPQGPQHVEDATFFKTGYDEEQERYQSSQDSRELSYLASGAGNGDRQDATKWNQWCQGLQEGPARTRGQGVAAPGPEEGQVPPGQKERDDQTEASDVRRIS